MSAHMAHHRGWDPAVKVAGSPNNPCPETSSRPTRKECNASKGWTYLSPVSCCHPWVVHLGAAAVQMLSTYCPRWTCLIAHLRHMHRRYTASYCLHWRAQNWALSLNWVEELRKSYGAAKSTSYCPWQLSQVLHCPSLTGLLWLHPTYTSFTRLCPISQWALRPQ